jgi:peptidyl-prolyl cis-trans isomerase SurA
MIIEPKVSKEAKEIAYQKILDLRNRVVGGESFTTLALIYSDDKGSATNGGELGYFTRGDMVPEFEAAAFRLRPDTVSKIIETKYGYHILKLIDRKGEKINVRHILIRPQIFRSDIQRSKDLMDSLVWQIKIDSVTFEEVAKKYSADEATKNNGGFITEGQTGTTRIPIDELEKEIYFKIERMEPGEISEPEQITQPGPDQLKVWRVFYLKSEAPPHRANLRDDYQKFQAMAMQKKQAQALNDYVTKARKDIYIKVSPLYEGCKPVQDILKIKKL